MVKFFNKKYIYPKRSYDQIFCHKLFKLITIQFRDIIHFTNFTFLQRKCYICTRSRQCIYFDKKYFDT